MSTFNESDLPEGVMPLASEVAFDPNRPSTARPGTLLDGAIEIAVQAHAGQVDKAGDPYILHCLRVMFALYPAQELMAAAVLHDALEDRPEFAPQIAALSSELLETVGCLTRRIDEPYRAYITRLSRNPDAKRIKVADLHDNLRPERVEKAHASGFIPRIRRYREALEKLTSVPDAHAKCVVRT